MNDTMSLIGDRRVIQQTSGDTGFVTRRIAGETIIVPVSSRVGDLDAIYTLNEAGSRVWMLLEASKSVQEIIAVLCDEYDAPRDEVATDLVDLLEALRANGLIRFADAAGG